MVKFEFGFSEFLEEVRKHLQYIIGKRASGNEFYFHHTACDADFIFIMDLTRELLGIISLKLGVLSEGFSIEGDTIIFRLNLIENERFYQHENDMKSLFAVLIRDGVIWRWFLFTGFENSTLQKEHFESLLELLISKFRSFSALPSRPLHPF